LFAEIAAFLKSIGFETSEVVKRICAVADDFT